MTKLSFHKRDTRGQVGVLRTLTNGMSALVAAAREARLFCRAYNHFYTVSICVLISRIETTTRVSFIVYKIALQVVSEGTRATPLRTSRRESQYNATPPNDPVNIDQSINQSIGKKRRVLFGHVSHDGW